MLVMQNDANNNTHVFAGFTCNACNVTLAVVDPAVCRADLQTSTAAWQIRATASPMQLQAAAQT